MRIEIVPFRLGLPSAAIVLLAGLAGCGSPRGAAAPKVPVSVARVERRSVPYELGANGTVEPLRSVDVRPQVNGTILRVHFAEGDEVTAGMVRSDSAGAAIARLNLEYATVRAPIAGRTGRILLHEGNLVRAGTDALVSIIQLRPILVRFAVPAVNLPALRQRAGQALTVLALPARDSATAVQGVLSFVDNQVDTATGSVLLKGRFTNREGTLWPGEFVSVTLVLGTQPDAIVVPSQAVLQGQQGTYVFVVNGDGTASTQSVTVERTLDSLTIVAGLPAGALVVTDGQLRLTPNSKVDIRGGPTTETAGGGTEVK